MNWCQQHPRYEGKGQPGYWCQQCWKLYFLRNPEDRAFFAKVHRELVNLKDGYW